MATLIKEDILQTKIITSWTDTYISEAFPWTPSNIKKWRITKIDTNWQVSYPKNTLNFPSAEFEFIADSALTYTYWYN